MAQQPTPEQMAQNMLKGVKNAYVFVAVRHVHPWYSWALMAAAIGFAVGVGYVANLRGTFDESQAAKMPVKNTMSVQSATVSKVEIEGRLAARINAAIASTPDTALAKIETGRVVDLSRGPGVFFDAPRPYNLRTTQGATAFSSDLRSLLSGSQPFRVSIGNSPANEWLAFGSTGTIPPGFTTEGQRCDCSGSVSFAVTCKIGGKDVVITRSAHAIANALDTAAGSEARDQAFTGNPDPKDSRDTLDGKTTLSGKNSLSCPQFTCENNLSACIPKNPPASVYEVLALGEGAGYSCSAKATGDAGITSICNASVVNPAK